MPKLTWSGDLRYRLAKTREALDEDRKFQQLRARLGVRAEVNEDVDAVIRLATANSSISSNQRLGDSSDPGSARRSFGIDLAYIDWNFLGLGEVWGGRVANPFWSANKNQLIFDADLAFEGLAIKYDQKWNHVGAFASLGGFIISENYSGAQDIVDTGLLGGEIGVTGKASLWSGALRAGKYIYTNIQNKPITVMDKDAKTDQYSLPFDRYLGNTVYPDDPILPTKFYFQYQYSIHQIGTEQKMKWRDFELMAFGDWLKNTKAPSKNRGYEYGAVFKWKFLFLGQAWVKKEADSVVGTFTDSDTNGGGTDNRGRRWWIGAQLGKNFQTVLTTYKARRGVDSTSRDYSGTQWDFSVSF